MPPSDTKSGDLLVLLPDATVTHRRWRPLLNTHARERNPSALLPWNNRICRVSLGPAREKKARHDAETPPDEQSEETKAA